MRISKFIFNGKVLQLNVTDSTKSTNIIAKQYESLQQVKSFVADAKCFVSIASQSDLNNAIFLNGNNLLPRSVNMPEIHNLTVPLNENDIISTNDIELDLAVFYEV